MQKYNSIIAVIERRMGKSTTTDNVELERMGRTLLGAKFKGVYASDGIPALTAKQPYAVINNKPARPGVSIGWASRASHEPVVSWCTIVLAGHMQNYSPARYHQGHTTPIET